MSMELAKINISIILKVVIIRKVEFKKQVLFRTSYLLLYILQKFEC